MTSYELLMIMEDVQEAYILDAYPKTKRNRVRWTGWAACLCLVMTVIGLWLAHQALLRESTKTGVYIPPATVSLSGDGDVLTDMIAFFIYQGRCYVFNQCVASGENLVGEYLGRATGLINEWTAADGYVELAGSVSGDFYAVNGYDAEFMLCMVDADGSPEIYICDTDITLCIGEELFSRRLHLEASETVYFQRQSNGHSADGEVYSLDISSKAMQALLEEINTAEFQLWSNEIPVEYYLYFQHANGVTDQIWIHSGGYVRYLNMPGICVKLSERTYNTLQKMLKSADSADNRTNEP